MSGYFDDPKIRSEIRDKIIGLGEHSLGKSYYPQLSQRIILFEQAEQALRESEQNYREIFNATAEAIVMFDLQTLRIVDVNRSAMELSGYSAQEMRQMSTGAFSSGETPYNRENALMWIRKAIEQGPQLFEWYFRRKDGTLFWGEVTTKLTEIGGHGRLLTMVRNIDERKRLEVENQARLTRVRKQERAILEIATLKEVLNGDLSPALQKVNEIAACVIGTDRVGLWLFNPTRDVLVGTDLYQQSTRTHSGGFTCRKEDYAVYFHALETERVIDAHDVRSDLRTREFNESYFIPNGIVSTLDAAIRMRGQVVGLISFEQVGSPKVWHADEIAFAGQLADQIIPILLNVERKKVDEEIRKLNDELELRVQQRTAQLEAVNKELESFAYTVSHDLRAPLRSISGFSTILSEDYASKFDADAVDYLNRIQKGCLRMEQLIEAILRLSRLTRVELKYESVNLSEAAAEIIDQFRNENPDRRVEVIIAPGMTVRGDAILLRVVLENLLGNAWKFTSYTNYARIEFGVQMHEGQSTFFIQDNGVGFDMTYAEKMFGAFQRLHRVEEFSGIGIGLATVQRIINRHGGSIWAQGAVDKGATFYFRL